MYILIKFEDINSKKTKETQELFFSNPNGTFLSSSYAQMISSDEMRKLVGYSVVFWYIDVDILNKHYGGVVNCLNELLKYPGVSSVDILPLEGNYDNFIRNYDQITNILMKYIDGVK